MKRIFFALCAFSAFSILPYSRTFSGFVGGAGSGALIGGLAGGGRGAGYGALAGGLLGTAMGASADADARRRYDYYYDDEDFDEYEPNYAYAPNSGYAYAPNFAVGGGYSRSGRGNNGFVSRRSWRNNNSGWRSGNVRNRSSRRVTNVNSGRRIRTVRSNRY